MLYHSNDPEKPQVFLLEPTGMSCVNIGGNTIYSGLVIRPGANLMGLSDKCKGSWQNKLSEVKLIITDELSMTSSDVFLDIHARLLEIFMYETEKPFAGLSGILLGDFLQLPLVKRKAIYSPLTNNDKLERLLSLQLWHFLKYVELKEVVRQNNMGLINLLNKVRVVENNENVENNFKARFANESYKVYPRNAMNICAEK